MSDGESPTRAYRKAAKDLAQELLRQWRSGTSQSYDAVPFGLSWPRTRTDLTYPSNTQHRQAEGSVVVYVVDPGPLIAPTSKPTAPQELLRCAVPILRATKDLPHLNIAFQILPSALLLEPWYRPRSIRPL
jgi:hypothetical protein